MSKAFKCDWCGQFFDGDPCIVGQGVPRVRRMRLENKPSLYPANLLFTVTVEADDRRELCDACWDQQHAAVVAQVLTDWQAER